MQYCQKCCIDADRCPCNKPQLITNNQKHKDNGNSPYSGRQEGANGIGAVTITDNLAVVIARNQTQKNVFVNHAAPR